MNHKDGVGGMRVLFSVVGILGVIVADARTFSLTVWRGETTAAMLPDFCELGARPSGISIRTGALKCVKYAPQVGSLQRLEAYDRVAWGAEGPGPRIVEVSASADAQPGTYVCGAMEVVVLERLLPPSVEWKYYLDLWQHPWSVARYFGVEFFSKEHYDKLRPIYELLATAGQKTITVSLLDEPWDHQCRDAYHSMFADQDFRLFDEYVEFCLSCGIGPDIFCYSLCPWKLKLDPGTLEFEAYWAPFLQKFSEHLRIKGWYGRVVMAMDERAPKQVKAVTDFVHKYAPGMRIAMAGNKPPRVFAGIDIDVYSQVLNHIDDAFLAECAERRKKGFVTTHYVCCKPTRPNTFMCSEPGESFWCGAAPGILGLDGFLRWAWNSWPQDPYVDASYGDWTAGDTFLCYPGGEPSWRFLELRNGIVAAEKIRVLNDCGVNISTNIMVRQFFDVKMAVSGRVDFVKARKALLDEVNRH